jgi:hypothetical protein
VQTPKYLTYTNHLFPGRLTVLCSIGLLSSFFLMAWKNKPNHLPISNCML